MRSRRKDQRDPGVVMFSSYVTAAGNAGGGTIGFTTVTKTATGRYSVYFDPGRIAIVTGVMVQPVGPGNVECHTTSAANGKVDVLVNNYLTGAAIDWDFWILLFGLGRELS